MQRWGKMYHDEGLHLPRARFISFYRPHDYTKQPSVGPPSPRIVSIAQQTNTLTSPLLMHGGRLDDDPPNEAFPVLTLCFKTDRPPCLLSCHNFSELTAVRVQQVQRHSFPLLRYELQNLNHLPLPRVRISVRRSHRPFLCKRLHRLPVHKAKLPSCPTL